MARSDPQVNVRLPEALLKRLRSASEASGKSLTQEITDRLEGSFPRSFDLLRLEQRQRQMTEYREMRRELKWLLEDAEDVEDATEEEREAVRSELARLDEAMKELGREIDALYAESKDSSVFGK